MNERLFHLSGTESLEDILALLRSTSADDIYLLFPRKSWIFSQITDLHALRDTADELGKILIVVTPNALARQTMQSIGIASIALLEEMEKTPFAKMKDGEKKSEEEEKKGGYQKIGETGKIESNVKNISVDPLMYIKRARDEKKCKKEKKDTTFFSRPALHALVLLGSIAVVLFLFILNIAIPESTIYISPAKKEEELHININFLSQLAFDESELWRVNHGVFSLPLEKVFYTELVYTNISKKFLGENAHGKIRITNPFHEKYTFQKGTRFETVEGIVFISLKWVTIPSQGEIIIDVESRETDNYAKFQGVRANIPKGQKMTIPGLPKGIREKFDVESVTAMQGGKTQWIRQITQENLQKSQEKVTKLANSQAYEELEYLLKQKNNTDTSDFIFLPFSGQQFEFEVLDTQFSYPKEEIIGKEVDNFRVKIKVRAKNFAYSRTELIEAMKQKFKKSAPEGMSLLSLDEDVLVPEVQDTKEESNRIKVSFSTRGVYQFIIEPKTKAGFEFVSRAKKEVAGMKIEHAKTELINNFPEVSDVEIKVWPVWLRRLPILEENIRFEIGEEL